MSEINYIRWLKNIYLDRWLKLFLSRITTTTTFFSAASKLELFNINRVGGGSAGEGWGFDQGTKILVNFPRVGRHTFIKVFKNLHPGVKYQIKGVLLKAGPRPAAQSSFSTVFCPAVTPRTWTDLHRSASGMGVQYGRRWVWIRLPI